MGYNIRRPYIIIYLTLSSEVSDIRYELMVKYSADNFLQTPF